MFLFLKELEEWNHMRSTQKIFSEGWYKSAHGGGDSKFLGWGGQALIGGGGTTP